MSTAKRQMFEEMAEHDRTCPRCPTCDECACAHSDNDPCSPNFDPSK